MKKAIILYLLLGCYLYTNGQLYQPFPDSGAIWKEYFVHYSGPIDRIEDRYSIVTGRDTVVQGVRYVTLWRTGISTEYDDHNQIINVINDENVYAGAIREDTAKKIFYFDITENLLYDFSLNVNDSLVGNYLWNLPSSIYISSIDSIFDGFRYRRRLHISEPNLGSDYIQLIEGIGSTWGLFNFFAPQGPSWGNLYCFSDGPSNLILDTVQCISTAIHEVANNEEKFKLYPNPSSFVIFIGNFVNIITSIEIYNLTGQLFSKQVGYDEQNGIDIENLPPSLYLIKINTPSHPYILRLVK